MSEDLPDVIHVRRLDQAKAVLHPLRVRILAHLLEPKTCAELARLLELTPQRIHHHLKALRGADLVQIVATRRVRNLTESTYQAVGKVVWLSPSLTRDLGDSGARDRYSLHHLLALTEGVQEDVASLLSQAPGQEVPSLGLSVEVHLRSEADRKRFAKEVLDALVPVIERHQGPATGSPFALTLMCYPKESTDG